MLELLVGIVLGGWVLQWFLDYHGHKCLTCGYAWRHLGLFSSGSARNVRALRAHTCGACGSHRFLRS
jgi:hypothetical protein